MIALYLVHLRKSNGWSQDQLAQRAGIPRQRISDYESGRHQPRGSALASLTRALGTELDVPPLLEPAIQRATAPELGSASLRTRSGRDVEEALARLPGDPNSLEVRRISSLVLRSHAL